jgi:hypothetical protein
MDRASRDRHGEIVGTSHVTHRFMLNSLSATLSKRLTNFMTIPALIAPLSMSNTKMYVNSFIMATAFFIFSKPQPSASSP